MNRFLERVLSHATQRANDVFCNVRYDGGDTAISWGNLLEKSRRYAALYTARGAKRNDIVFIILKHGPDLYPAFIGAMLAGAIPSFLPFPTEKQDPELYWSLHRRVFARTNARFVLTYNELETSLTSAVGGLQTSVGTTCEALPLAPFPLPEICSGTEIALLQHSSGTTGLKKGVMLSYDAITLQIEAYLKALKISDHRNIRIAGWLPLYHDMGLITSFLLPLYAGAQVAAIDAFEWASRPEILFEAIETYNSTHVWLPNFAFNHLRRAVRPSQRYDLSSVRAFINCSEPCKAETFDSFVRRFRGDGVVREQLLTCYAMAETVFAVTQSEPGREPMRLEADAASLEEQQVFRPRGGGGRTVVLISNGTVIEGLELAVMQGDEVVGDGIVGELAVRGAFLFSGYFGESRISDDTMTGDWYLTGDLGFIIKDQVFVTGRIKEVIIVNGRNYYAHDLEEIASETPGVRPGRVVALGRYDCIVGSEQLVLIAERDGPEDADAHVVSALTQKLVRTYGVMAGDIHMTSPNWLIKTTSGKISRSENLLKYLRELR